MLDRFKHIVSNHFPELYNTSVYLAVSGGIDSMVLSHLLTQLGIKHHLLHCNFQLRGEDSDTDESFVKEYAAKNKLEIDTIQFDTANIARENNLTIQEAARKLRYEWFSQFLDSNAILLTAHHADDSVETFFINLMRGSGIKGLSGISKKRENILRPLIHFTRDDINQHQQDSQIPYREDKSNFENKYVRNYLRHEIIPRIAEKSPDFNKKMTQTMDSLNDISNWMNSRADEFKDSWLTIENDAVRISKQELLKQELIFIEFIMAEYGIFRNNSESFKSFLSAETGSEFKSESHHFFIDRESLIIQSAIQNKSESIEIVIDELPFTLDTRYLSLELSVINSRLAFNDNVQQFDFGKIIFPLTLRNWRQGDKLIPLGMKGRKLVSDILIDKKIPKYLKDKQLVLINGNNEIISLIGHVVSDAYKLSNNSKEILSIRIK